MDRAERMALVVDALTAGMKDDHNVIQLVDLGEQEHWVRVWDFGEDPNTHLTVTNRASPGSPLPALTRKQIDRLVALGMGREARPDFEGDLTGEQAREAYRPYAGFDPEIYDLDYEEENEWGFPLCTDDLDDISVSRIAREADAAGIPGVGVAWGNLSPMSGEPLNVEGDDALDRLRRHFQGRYLIVDTGDDR